MNISDILQVMAVLCEIIIGCAGVVIAIRKKKTCGWFIAITFGLFVIFDVARIFALAVPEDLHALIFLVACVSMLFGVWLIYNEEL
jgi:hypothetical protein